MTDSRTCCSLAIRSVLALLPLGESTVRAQPPVLAPTANTTIVVPNGPLHYSSIHVPAGVTVRFVAPGGSLSIPARPAILHCDGDAIVHGTVWLRGDSPFTNDRPAGWVTTGHGPGGNTCGSVVLQPPGGGRHARTYGSVLPFSLEGGSLGGGISYWDPGCTQFLSNQPDSEGGGTLVLLAGGRIEVHGTIGADGAGGLSGGSGGSILLRGDDGVIVFPSGSVTARGGLGSPQQWPWPVDFSDGARGLIRLDAWGDSPVIAGTVDPAPTVLALPHLRPQSRLAIGTTWTLAVFAPDTAWVYVAASSAPASVATPFGTLGLDLATTTEIALTVPQPSHDPVATVQWPIPNAPSLIGLALWVQAIAVPPNLSARLSNTLAVVVQ